MASVSYLVDTDILIDWLKGLPWAKRLVWSGDSSLLQVHDALVAATAWTKRLPLLTRNDKHYAFIAEIELVSIEDMG